MSTATPGDRRRLFGLRPLWAVALVLLAPRSVLAAGASLRILGEDEGRPVWIQRSYAGVLPLLADSLPAGEIDIEVGGDPSERGWVHPWSVTLRPRPGSLDTLLVPALQVLRLVSEPTSARVWFEGTEIGRTPVSLLVPARELLRLKLEGETKNAVSLEYDGRGRPDSTLLVDIGGKPQLSESALTGRPPGLWARRGRWFFPAFALAAGAAGFWAGEEADNAYAAYLGSLDRERMRRELSRARRYDRLASSSLVLAELGLAAAVWSWLRPLAESPLELSPDPSGGVRVGIRLLPSDDSPSGDSPANHGGAPGAAARTEG